MQVKYRCWSCWHRCVKAKRIELYEKPVKCAKCGKVSLFRPKDREAKRRYKGQCNCDAYHYPHGKGRGLCRPGEQERRELEYRQDKLDLEGVK